MAAVQTVLESGQLVQGRWVAEFEEAFASFCGAPYAVATSNGTTALHLALLHLNPMAGLIGGFRTALFGGAMPWSQLASAAGLAVLAFLVGCFYFRKVEDDFADMI